MKAAAFLVAIGLMMGTGVSLHAQTVFVDANAVGANNGSSWADAYVDLQDALSATASGQLWVAQGSYRPAPVGQPTISFQLKNQVALYGGFAGTETSLSQRDVILHPTVLSGDLAADDTYGGFSNWWQFGWGNSVRTAVASSTAVA